MAAAATFRDRTSEFVSLSNTLRRVGGNALPPLQSQSNDPISVSPDRSEFNKKASRIGLHIHQTSQKIDRLSNLTKRSSIFDDRNKENEELTALIKNDITGLNVAISDLQTLQNMEIADGNYSGDRVVHLTTVCDDLKNRLMNVTKHFQDVLTTRTKNIKAHENRKQLFSTVVSRENPLKEPPNTVTEPPPWSSSAERNLQSSITRKRCSNWQPTKTKNGNGWHSIPSNGSIHVAAGGSTARKHLSGSDGALQNVESTISELSGIFTHLATMVAHQGELAIRIDDNMDESLANVEGASNALLKYLNRISSNRISTRIGTGLLCA
ncbi:UNVERIFIED_CONTAM: syntaxin [Sesamum calycinum]|uniref:Syntaxin n=1 Tax=Sesamum calycinum TaxID=2727403 RepID=A0AAW2RPR4_9LAMI